MTPVLASAWGAVRTLDVYQVHEVPRLSPGTRPADRSPHGELGEQRLAALVSAYHADAGPILIGWHRPSPTGPVAVYVGGVGLAGTEEGSGHAVVSLPAGGGARRLPAGAVAEALADLPYWTPIAVITDGLLADEQPRLGQEALVRPSLEDCLLGVWHQAFAWLVIAQPLTGTDLDKRIKDVGNAHREVSVKVGSSPDYAVKTRRLEHQHRQLCQAVSTGLWRTYFLAGGTSPTAAHRIAGLLCASTDLDRLPYALVPGTKTDQLETLLDTTMEIHGGDSPFYATTPLLAAIAKPPALEVPGVHFSLRPEFDVTPETITNEKHEGAGLRLGHVLDRNRMIAGDLLLPYSSLNRHTFVCGATGAGKSQTIRGLLQACTAQGLPWLVIEPAKAEYRLMATRLADTSHTVVAIRPGEVDALPAGINPLEPALNTDGTNQWRYPLQTHADLVRALFLAAFESDEPFPQVLSAALTRCYEQLGWDLALGQPRTPGVKPRYPTLVDLQQAAEDVVDQIGYSKRITDDIRGFIRVRLSSLRLGTTGRFFEGGHLLNFDALLKNNVVFEIEDVGDDRDKAFLIGTALIRLVEHLRLTQRREGGIATPLRHITVIEEAHRLLRRSEETGPAAHAVEMFAGLLAEIRAYGEGLVIAEQIPTKLLPDVIKNTAIKIVHRLPAHDDRDAVGATMNITTTQSEYLVTLPPGHAAVFTDGMDYPLLVAMQDGTRREANNLATPANPTHLVTPRSRTCGLDCQNAPCTLRQIRAAQHVLRRDSWLVLWAELAVLAHLIGCTTPKPRRSHLNAIQAMDVRTRDCALSHAIDHAVATRSTVIAERISPTDLAVHVIDALRLMIATGQRHIAEEPQWLAPAYQWHLVWDQLAATGHNNPTAGRHPRSNAWEQHYGKPIPGQTNHQQLATVQRWHNSQRDPTVLHIIAYGTHRTPAIATAINTKPDAPDWEDKLTEHLNAFIGCRWPLSYLTPPHTRGSQ
jgi:uncharacterized protein